MYDRPAPGNTAILVNLAIDGESVADALEEFQELATSAGARTLAVVTGSRRTPDPRFYVGKGKADAIKDAVAATGAEVVLVNHPLAPSQERNLERHIGCRVVDRASLILDIFAQRAESFEGKLQVELAQLRHLASRLVRGWTHLERQKGGIGLRGPGETQLETDRRLLGRRIRLLVERLDGIRSSREQNRRARVRGDCYTVSLVGYTNAGKSTLFNRLTGAGAYAADRLFATLDPKLRRVQLPGGGGEFVVIDTVGFIRDLPHELVAAFRATLEETVAADLLLHVIDAGDDLREERRDQVRGVLADIGAADLPLVEVWNKIDLLPATSPHVERGDDGAVTRVWLCAGSGAGLHLLAATLAERLQAGTTLVSLRVPVTAAAERARLFRSGTVVAESLAEDGAWLLKVRLDARARAQLSPEVEVLGGDPGRQDPRAA